MSASTGSSAAAPAETSASPVAAAAAPSASNHAAAAAGDAPAAAAVASATSADSGDDTLVQYVVMRSDLIKTRKWNIGGLIANGSHACVSAIVQFQAQGDADVAAYVAPDALAKMHKVVLSVPNEDELAATSALLDRSHIKHVVWTEQPENYRSCLALKPYRRSIVQPLLRHLKLFR
jgi:peptidyl-tRNA hydrolase